MDILKPQLIYIDGKCYRKDYIQQHQETGPYIEEDEYFETGDGSYDEACDETVNLEETQNGFRLRMSIPTAYFKYIIGKKGETKRRLENDTKTQIKIPSMGNNGDVVVNGRDKKGVLSAKSRIDILVESARQKQPFTHFLSFPVHFEKLQENFNKFKETVLENCKGDRGLDETIFQKPCKLHITVGVMALMNDAEIEQAVKILHQCQTDLVPDVVGSEPLYGKFHGLEYMNDDPSEVDVLYGKIELQDGSERLQRLADRLLDEFVSAGLMAREYDRVKLHVTLMNTLMRKDPGGAFQPKSSSSNKIPFKNRESFNAASVLKKFGNFDFGTHRIDEIHLSQRYGTSCDGYYGHAGKIQLP